MTIFPLRKYFFLEISIGKRLFNQHHFCVVTGFLRLKPGEQAVAKQKINIDLKNPKN